jgi:hypothetical protein
MHNWMQSTSKRHLKTRSHCYSRDHLPRGHHRGCSSTAPETTASLGQAQQFTPATAPQMAWPHPQTVLVREPHIICMRFRLVFPTSACPLNLSGIPLRIALGSLEATPPAFRTAPFGGAHKLPFLEATTKTSKTLILKFSRLFLPFASTWDRQLGNAASTRATGKSEKNRWHGVMATRT